MSTPLHRLAFSPPALLLLVVVAGAHALLAHASGTATHACSLLTRDEAMALAPWSAPLDTQAPKAEKLSNGSACTYPTFRVQVMDMPASSWARWIDSFRKQPHTAVNGVGEEAFLRENDLLLPELAVRHRSKVVTVQYTFYRAGGESTDASKLKVMGLGKAMVQKLR